MLLLVKLQVLACNFTNSNTRPWVFLTFFKLCTLYQIAQSDLFCCSQFLECIDFKLWFKSYVGPDFRIEIASRNNSVVKGRNLCPFCPCRFFFIKTIGIVITSVIRQKVANLKAGFTRKQSTPNFPKNEHFLPPDTNSYVCVSWVRNVRFSENLVCFVFF